MNNQSTHHPIAVIALFLFTVICHSQEVSLADDNNDWLQFLGNDGRGVAAESAPLRWSLDENLQWRTVLPGRGWSSPVIAGGRVYLTAAVPIESVRESTDRDESSGEAVENEVSEFDLCMLIVDLESGRLVKRVSVMVQNDERPSRMHGKNSHASPTPIVDGDRIFVHFGYQGTACLTLDGELLWVNRDLYFPPTHGNGGSPILIGGKLIFTCDGGKDPKVIALEAETGEVAWQVHREVEAKKTFSFCTPSVIKVGDRDLVVVPGSDVVQALDPATGEVVWYLHYTGYSVVPKPVSVAGLVVLSTGFDQATMLAIDPTGTGNVTDSKLVWEIDRNIPKTPSLIADQGLIYTISDDGIALCIDGASGDLLYRERIGGNYSSSPIIAGDYIYFTSETGKTTVVRTGVDFDVVAESDLEERTLATMAFSEGAILLRTDEALYRISH